MPLMRTDSPVLFPYYHTSPMDAMPHIAEAARANTYSRVNLTMEAFLSEIGITDAHSYASSLTTLASNTQVPTQHTLFHMLQC